MYRYFQDHTKRIKKSHFHLKNIFSYIVENTERKIYKYHLIDGKQVHIELKKEQIPHLMGLHHFSINNLKKLKGFYAVNLIEKEYLNVHDLMSDKTSFEKHKDRLFHLHSIPKILEEANCLRFDATRVKFGDSLFSNLHEISLFLKNSDIKLLVYLGLKNIQKNQNIYFYEAATFVVDRQDKYRNGVTELEIVTREVIEY